MNFEHLDVLCSNELHGAMALSHKVGADPKGSSPSGVVRHGAAPKHISAPVPRQETTSPLAPFNIEKQQARSGRLKKIPLV